MTQQEAERTADALRRRVLTRTGLRRDQLQCPRERSDMTPCVARDGGLAVTLAEGWAHPAGKGAAICVGCEASVRRLLDAEERRC